MDLNAGWALNLSACARCGVTVANASTSKQTGISKPSISELSVRGRFPASNSDLFSEQPGGFEVA